MKKTTYLTRTLFLTLMTSTLTAQADVQGDVKLYSSPRGLTEKCVALGKLPGGQYTKKDLEKEAEFCGINFYDNSVALCAKTWSTSPGTIINDNRATKKTSIESERAYCGPKNTALSSLAKYKQTMNSATTSGTYSTSSLLYYHLSRVLKSTVGVPVAVYRTMDKTEHYERVSSKARPSQGAAMNYAGWQILKAAELNPKSYGTFAIDLFTEDYKQIKGVILKSSGERYDAEINGTRAGGWGNGQNYSFQKTPAFLALQSAAPIQQAFDEASNHAFRDATMARAFSSDRSTRLGRASDVQMSLWMREVSEIAILDYILSQQDRIGNIDYQWYWLYRDASGAFVTKKDSSKLPRTQMNKIPVPKELAAFQPTLVQKSFINDNDAGGMMRYANFAKATHMLDGEASGARAHAPLRHLNIDTYRALINLANDFEAQGPIYQQMQLSFDGKANIFNVDRMKTLSHNIQSAAEILKNNCERKILRFDIPDLASAYAGDFREQTVQNCARP